MAARLVQSVKAFAMSTSNHLEFMCLMVAF